MLTIIAAITASGAAIGRKGGLLYPISADLKRFKALTTGHTVIMGRRTFDSLPKGALPNRRNIVVTSNPAWSAPGAERASSVEEAVAMAAATPDSHAFIIGGGQIYAQSLPLAETLELTIIEAPCPPDADTFFPPIDPSMWEITDIDPDHTDPASGLRYSFTTLSRVKPAAE